LRYCIDFISDLYPEKDVQQFLDKLQPIQEYLGFYNDLFVAEHIFEEQATEHPQFLFALGWVKAQQPHVAKKAAKKLEDLSIKDIFGMRSDCSARENHLTLLSCWWHECRR
jgi:CHAD domain-containing protein